MKFIKYFLIIFILAGCQQTNKDKFIGAKEIINIPQATDINIEDLIEEFDTIRLEASHRSLLSNIREIRTINNKLYITDNTRVFVFIYTLGGKYISKICDQGEGPNEYIKIASIEANPHTKQLLLTDNFSKKLFEYNENGEIKHLTKLSFLPTYFASDNHGEYVHLNSGPHIISVQGVDINKTNVIYIDKQGNIIKHILADETPNRIDITGTSCNYTTDGNLLYMPMLSNTVYRIDKEQGYTAEYTLLPTNKKLLSQKEKENIFFEHKANGLQTNLTDFEKEGFFISCGSFLKSDSLMIFNLGYEEFSRVFYSIKDKKAFTINLNEISGNKGLCEIFSNIPKAIIGETIYISVAPEQIAYTLPLLPEGKLKTFFESFTEEDNPCIIAYRINKKLFDAEG